MNQAIIFKISATNLFLDLIYYLFLPFSFGGTTIVLYAILFIICHTELLKVSSLKIWIKHGM